MAIKLRRGTSTYFDPNKLVQGELGLVTDTGELYFCYSAGNTKKLATKDDLQTMLDSSATAYSALVQLIADLETNPSELTNILNNITALQSGKIDKTSITRTAATNDASMVPSSEVTYALQQSVNTINDNLGDLHYYTVVLSQAITYPYDALNSIWASIADNTIFMVYVSGSSYSPDYTIIGSKTSVSYGAIVVFGYSKALTYYSCQNGVWS